MQFSIIPCLFVYLLCDLYKVQSISSYKFTECIHHSVSNVGCIFIIMLISHTSKQFPDDCYFQNLLSFVVFQGKFSIKLLGIFMYQSRLYLWGEKSMSKSSHIRFQAQKCSKWKELILKVIWIYIEYLWGILALSSFFYWNLKKIWETY